MLNNSGYNPDVLSCIANLSSDEVFTPPKLANQMLDLLPEKIWSDKNAKFLDPVCKSGVFLREIAKRLNTGLEKEIPNKQKRIDHIFKNQLYGIGITELTSLLSRRSLYCSKTANGKYSVCETFDDKQGNIKFNNIKHIWKDGKCRFCGAGQEVYERDEELETHAYHFIHIDNPKDIFKMKFDVIVGNPPYQLNDGGGTGSSASPIYHHFITQAKKINPRYLTMIIPSRWFAGGKGLDEFRDTMLHDQRISHLIDYPIASDVFPGVKIIGGVCYFLWGRDFQGACSVTTNMNDFTDTMIRPLDQFDTFVRFNKAISIIEKINIDKCKKMSDSVSNRMPFGMSSLSRPTGNGDITLYAWKSIGKIERATISSGIEMIDSWKVLISKGYGEGGESREYPRMIIGKPIIAPPASACTETYLVAGTCRNKKEAQNLASYIQTKFLRFLTGLIKNTQNISRKVFAFVPIQDFNENWTDEKLYKKYGLTVDEIAFIESMIRPMESNNE